MKVLTRTTAQGNEYWDTELKKSLFVPAGQEPGFEVIENPKSMISGVDLATGKDDTVILNAPAMIDDMTIKELRVFAVEAKIDIPSDIKKQKDIADYIENYQPADDDE